MTRCSLPMESSYRYQANARPIEQRSRYRGDTLGPIGPCMITADPRIARGSTIRRTRQFIDEDTVPVQTKTRTRTINDQQVSLSMRDGRVDIQLQTDPYLHQCPEPPVLRDLESQTDAFLDRPETPPFLPPKNGIDIEIQTDEGLIFEMNFDFEVQPIVSTIVGKTLEQAFLEVHEEAELEAVKRENDAIKHRRDVQLADVQRLEEAERRRFDEKQRRVEQKQKAEREERELRLKVAARGYAGFFASDLVGDTISILERRGYFYDEVEREVEALFMPWLTKGELEADQTRLQTEAIIQNVIKETEVVQESDKAKFRECLQKEAQTTEEQKATLLRQMLVEDLGSAKIRQALNEAAAKKRESDREDASNDDE